RERHELIEELIGNLLMQQQARACNTGLSLVVEDRERAAGYGSLEVGVIEDDIGALTSEFELDTLEIARRSLHDLAPCDGRAGEPNLVNRRMLGQILASHCAIAGQDVDYAARDSDFGHELGDLQ